MVSVGLLHEDVIRVSVTFQPWYVIGDLVPIPTGALAETYIQFFHYLWGGHALSAMLYACLSYAS
eukprot:47321-Eustigmatos_ZCMA.PRE.1